MFNKSSVLALLAFAGLTLAADDWIIQDGSFTAADLTDNDISISASYAIDLPTMPTGVTPSADTYIVAGGCTATTKLDETETSIGVSLTPISATSTTIADTMTIDLAAVPSTHYTENGSTFQGTLNLCHVVELKANTVLMNKKRTDLTVTVSLTASFDVDGIDALVADPVTDTASAQIAASQITATAVPDANVAVGTEIVVTITSGVGSEINVNQVRTLTVSLGGTDQNMISTGTIQSGFEANVVDMACGTNTPSCVFSLFLPFSYFEATNTVGVTGTVAATFVDARRALDAADGAELEDRQLSEPPQEVNFQLEVGTVADEESGTITMKVVGSVATLAVSAIAAM